MKVVTVLCLCFGAALIAFNSSGPSQASVSGIVPLHSTRLNLERRFGRSADACRCVFETAKESIIVDYALAPCKGPLYGWNVPKDTVLAFRIRPKQPIPISEINLDPSHFIQTHSEDENITVFYTDALNGIKYAVQEDNVIYIRRVPSTEDNGLRCPGFPPYDGGVAEYRSYDSFTTKSDLETSARLDNYAAQLAQAPSLKGYILAYAGKIAKKNEGRNMAEWARQYLIERRNIPPDLVSAVDGGFREIPGYDLFLLPRTARPPTPTPTVASNEIRIVR